eukprot:34190-Hanusia_phi.AAC.6
MLEFRFFSRPLTYLGSELVGARENRKPCRPDRVHSLKQFEQEILLTIFRSLRTSPSLVRARRYSSTCTLPIPVLETMSEAFNGLDDSAIFLRT